MRASRASAESLIIPEIDLLSSILTWKRCCPQDMLVNDLGLDYDETDSWNRRRFHPARNTQKLSTKAGIIEGHDQRSENTIRCGMSSQCCFTRIRVLKLQIGVFLCWTEGSISRSGKRLVYSHYALKTKLTSLSTSSLPFISFLADSSLLWNTTYTRRVINVVSDLS